MFANLPEVAEPRDRRSGTVDFRNDVGFIQLSIAYLANEYINFGSVEARYRDVKIRFDRELLQLQGQQSSVPPGFLRKSVVRDDIGSDLSRGEAVDANSRDIRHPHGDRCFDPGVPGDNPVGAINQNWIDEAEFLDARGDLLDLTRSVRTRVCWSRF
jgi:hypothetical protein